MKIIGTWLMLLILVSWSTTVVSKTEVEIPLVNDETQLQKEITNLFSDYCHKSNLSKLQCNGLFFSELMKNVYNNLNNKNAKNLLSIQPVKVWLYSMGGATLILVLSMLGALLLGLAKSSIVSYIILTIQAFAVGVLSGNALIHLIPDGLGIDETPWYDYTWKSFVSAMTVVLFCITDAIIRLYGSWASEKKLPTYTVMDACGGEHHNHVPENKDNNSPSIKNPSPIVESTTITANGEYKLDSQRINCFGTRVESQGIMIIIGDMLHNFIDGLAIGVSFSTSTYKGWSTLVSVIAEEVPHEIGDMTILVNSGFSIYKAIFWNLVSCSTCHFGVVIALSLGDLNNNAKDYIEMICGGAFLYISFLGVYPHVMELCVQLANNKLRRYQLNLLLVYSMIIAGQAFMGGVSYLE